jgi:hypothetical protein
MIYRRAWPTRHELEIEVFSFIEGFYNPLRRHSRLGKPQPRRLREEDHDTERGAQLTGVTSVTWHIRLTAAGAAAV